MQIINTQGERLYLTISERAVSLKTASKAPRDVRTFCLVPTLFIYLVAAFCKMQQSELHKSIKA